MAGSGGTTDNEAPKPLAGRTSAGPKRLNRDFLSNESWIVKNHGIIEEEIAAINTRRERDGTAPVSLTPAALVDVVGLSLSGGGIRSAAVSLGVVQALNHHDCLKHIDYLSTVSGGGYFGASLSATMAKAKRFIFGGPPNRNKTAPASEISDTPAVGHLRNYANYLVPSGARDLTTSIAIIVRGLVANLGLMMPVVLFLAAMTILSNPTQTCLSLPNFFGVPLKPGAKDSGLIDLFAFTLIGAAIGVVLVICREVLNFFRHHEVGANRRVVLFYIVGITFAVGLICDGARHLDVKNFAMTISACLIGLAGFFWWALLRSLMPAGKLQEFRGHGPTIGATYLLMTVTIAFLEVQPFIIAAMFHEAEGVTDPTGGAVAAAVVTGWIKSLTAITAPIAVVVTFFRQQFTAFAKSGSTSQALAARLGGFAATAALWIGGLALPLLIWVGYLYLCYWGIVNDRHLPQCPQNATAIVKPATDQVVGKLQFDTATKTFSSEFTAKPAIAPETASSKDMSPRLTTHVPVWLLSLADNVRTTVRSYGPDRLKAWADATFKVKTKVDEPGRIKPNLSMLALYWIWIISLFFLSWWLRPNANSLHRLYRDRLSKAFLFDPEHLAVIDEKRSVADGATKHVRVSAREPVNPPIAKSEPSMDQGRDFLPLDDIKLSQLFPIDVSARTLHGPYHIINAALNIQGSDYANRRGRNADFFMFSPLHVGSDATGYIETERMEACAPALDVATAMAISGAAASSNMGSASIRPLTPTLALLNIRLGYWLKNPRYATCEHDSERFKHLLTLPKRGSTTPFYLWSEITGRLYENSDDVYLTDGGHIENLGIYELLRRRCKVIIAVDAETDPDINCTSLIALERYARIDLGIRINLPWPAIRSTTRAWMDLNAKKELKEPPKPGVGPHIAIGTIDYGGNQKGYLVYIKASLNGDENDYICDHARRNDRFPQESTGDQFFTEEQFEVYRALGFHMVQGWLDGADDVAVNGKPGDPDTRCQLVKFNAPGNNDVKAVRAALRMEDIKA